MTDRLTCRRCEGIVSKTETTCYEKWGHSREWVAENIDTYLCRDCLREIVPKASERSIETIEKTDDTNDTDSTENSAIDNWV